MLKKIPKHQIKRREYEIKATPTVYSGVEFKSQSEARWAVFFDVLKIKWKYEPLLFKFEPKWYRPDFFLEVGEGIWVEIKPAFPTPMERYVMEQTVQYTGYNGLFLHPDHFKTPLKGLYSHFVTEGRTLRPNYVLYQHTSGEFRYFSESIYPLIFEDGWFHLTPSLIYAYYTAYRYFYGKKSR